jgi:corrinoid protein of di/trimethylamine methyltransferase
MARAREDILKDLAESVLEMRDADAVAAAREAIASGLDAQDAIDNGLIAGMTKAGELYEKEEYFVPELLLCSDALYTALEVLRPHLSRAQQQRRHACVIGVVEGDTHDIGKNLVKIMLDVAGLEVHDLGRNVPLRQFVEKAKEVQASLICMSTLMTTTMDNMATVIEMLKEEGLRSRFKVMVGGGPISPAFADQIGADGYASNASGAAKLALQLCASAVAA